jgi:hypothetical protein
MTGSVGLLRSMLPFFLAVAAFVLEDVQHCAVQAASPKGEQQKSLPPELRELFARLDSLGRDKVKDARFVELRLSSAEEPSRRRTEKAWVVSESDEVVSVLKEDLLPWTYQKRSDTKLPSSWHPAVVRLESITEVDFESHCKELVRPEPKPKDELEKGRRSLYAPGPSYRLLMAHAAWKKGLSQYCETMVVKEPTYEDDFPKYRAAVLEDLAWLHFLRGVNLLMYADRREVLPHLRLVIDLSPKGEYAAQAQDLLKHLERLIADEGRKNAAAVDMSKLPDSERAKRYIAQLRDLCCPQIAQPGFIEPYTGGFVNGKPVLFTPTLALRGLGVKAVPALIEALEDDTPTRTVYHWRDFSRSRLVWRVSDFAWTILRDITQMEFGYRRVVGFTLGSMKPEEKRRVIEEIRKWHKATSYLSPDDRVFAAFSSSNPEDWIKAGQYFLKKKDRRAVKPLLEKISQARSFSRGQLCELVAKFGDASAKEPIKRVMDSAEEHSDRLSAAIALWTLGDDAGIPMVMKYVKAEKQPYGNWDTPVWFLMRTRTKEAMDALKSVVVKAPGQRAGEVAEHILVSITGDLWGERREPAGCVEICPVLIAGMERGEYTGGTVNDIKIRTKDCAAKALVLLKDGAKDRFGGRFAQVDPKAFNELEPSETKRDAQIRALRQWYDENKDKLIWDSKNRKLAVKQTP